MQQRTIFIYGLIVLAIALFVVRMVLVNEPEQVSDGSSKPELIGLPLGNEKMVEILANQPGWRAVGRGPLSITADGTADLGGGLKTVPDDRQKPGDDKALVPGLPYGMLVGKIGERGEPFRIGRHAQIAMKETIFLAINDADYSDNSASYAITLTGGTKY